MNDPSERYGLFLNAYERWESCILRTVDDGRVEYRPDLADDWRTGAPTRAAIRYVCGWEVSMYQGDSGAWRHGKRLRACLPVRTPMDAMQAGEDIAFLMQRVCGLRERDNYPNPDDAGADLRPWYEVDTRVRVQDSMTE